MQGTRDSAVIKEKHAYITYDVLRCTHETKAPDDPECADEAAIDEWLKHKKIFVRFLNDKINFMSRDGNPISQSEVWLPTIPMKAGSRSDTGYRMKKNIYLETGMWFPFGGRQTEFYDIKLYNSDTFEMEANTTKVIASMFFRIDTDIIQHTMIVFHLTDLLSEIGGLGTALTVLMSAALGGYMAYLADVKMVMHLYNDSVMFNDCGD